MVKRRSRRVYRRSKRVSRRRVTRRTRRSSRRRVSKRQRSSRRTRRSSRRTRRSSRRTRRRMKGGGDHASDEPVKYRAVAQGVIRKLADKKSEKVGDLPVGAVIEVLSTEEVTGTTRVKFVQGWVSVIAGSGKILLEPVLPEIIKFIIVRDPEDTDGGLGLKIIHPTDPKYPSLIHTFFAGITEEDMVQDLRDFLKYGEEVNISNIEYYLVTRREWKEIKLENVPDLKENDTGILTFHFD